MPADAPFIQTWLIPVVGLGSAGLALVVGRALFRRSAPPALAPKSPPNQELPAPENCKDRSARLQRTEKPLQTLVTGTDPFDHGSAKERRTAHRRTGKCVKVLVSKSETEEPEHGYIVDRSLGGICFTFPRSLPVNQELGICSAERGTAAPWVYVRVKRCELKDDKEWEIGCQFVDTPTWATMMQFG